MTCVVVFALCFAACVSVGVGCFVVRRFVGVGGFDSVLSLARLLFLSWAPPLSRAVHRALSGAHHSRLGNQWLGVELCMRLGLLARPLGDSLPPAVWRPGSPAASFFGDSSPRGHLFLVVGRPRQAAVGCPSRLFRTGRRPPRCTGRWLRLD